jgi:hypothetical protein
MVVMMGAAILLVSVTMLIHYEALRLASDALPSLPLPMRFKIIVLVFVSFLAHTIEIWTYALALWLIAETSPFGELVTSQGAPIYDFFDYVYFSAATYTTIGFGDVVPRGPIRLLAGVEALNGLVLIGWSASVTYLAMQQFWPLHKSTRHRRDHNPHHTP